MTRRALAAWSLIVMALAAAVAVDRPRSAAELAAPERLLPGFTPDDLQRLRITRAGRPELLLERAGSSWMISAPVHAPADPGAVRDLFGTLELLSARRRVPAEDSTGRGLDAPALAIAIERTDGDNARLRFGRAAGAGLLGRVWANQSPGEDLLVEEYAVRALELGSDELRLRAPFLDPAAARRFEFELGTTRVVLAGRPMCVQLDGGCVRADTARVAALEQALARVTMTRFDEGGPSGPPRAAVIVDGVRLELFAAPCAAGGERWVQSPLGRGCIEGAVADAVEAALVPPRAWVATQLVTLATAAIDRLQLGALLLERRGGGWQRADGTPVDGAAVLAWLERAAATTGTVVDVPTGTGSVLVVRAGGLEERLTLVGDRVRRDDEPVALRVPASARELFDAVPLAFADRRVFSFEPYALAAVEIVSGRSNARFRRGATAEQFVREPGGEPIEIEPLRRVASNLTAERVVAAQAEPAHGLGARSLTFVLDPPPGQTGSVRATLELGAQTLDGSCYARRADAAPVFLLDRTACAVLARPWGR